MKSKLSSCDVGILSGRTGRCVTEIDSFKDLHVDVLFKASLTNGANSFTYCLFGAEAISSAKTASPPRCLLFMSLLFVGFVLSCGLYVFYKRSTKIEARVHLMRQRDVKDIQATKT